MSREEFERLTGEAAAAETRSRVAATELTTAIAALEGARGEVDNARAEHLSNPTVGPVRRLAAEPALRAAEMAHEAAGAQLQGALDVHSECQHAADMAELAWNGEQRAALRLRLKAPIGELVALARRIDEEVERAAAIVDQHQQLEDRAREIIETHGMHDPIWPIDTATVRTACTIVIAREIGCAELPEGEIDRPGEVLRAINRLSTAVQSHKASALAAELERCTSELTSVLGGESSDWIRPAYEPTYDDTSAYAALHKKSAALVDEILPAEQLSDSDSSAMSPIGDIQKEHEAESA